MSKHYRLQFDNIALFSTDASPEILAPLLESRFNAVDGVYHPDQKISLAFEAFNLPNGNGEVSYSVEDAFGKKVASGKTDLKNSAGSIKLTSSVRGYFSVNCKLGKTSINTSYVVIEPVKAEYIPDSRFGCHALLADGYRIHNWPEFQETMMRRAFLAGAKWVRHHSIKWSQREPEKGKYDWTYFDDRLALAEKYKMEMLLTICETPKWASSSSNMKMTCCGTFYYQNYPPKKWQDWADFVSAVVSRYKNKIKWYELWNEPGNTSAFWTNGSAEDFGMLLKTGYEAAKKTDPNCVVLSGAPLTPGFMADAIKSTGGKLYFDVMSFHYSGSDKRGETLFSKWKSLLTQFGGGNIPMTNTEEMSWTRPGALDFSAALLKLYIREAAQGISKTFAFDFFHTGSQFGASAFDICGNPLPQYAAYRTMTHQLEYAKFVTDLSTAESEVYLFDRQGSPVLVMWSDKGRYIELPLGIEKAVQVNIMDVESPLRAAGGNLRLKGSVLPVFVKGGDMKLLTVYGRVRNAFPRSLMVKQGATIEVSLNLDAVVSGLKLDLPRQWNGSVDLTKLWLSAPKDVAEGTYEATVRASVNGHSFSVPVIIDVNNGVPGANLVRNGDLVHGYANFFFPKDKNKFDAVKGAGGAGSNALRTRGPVFFGYAGRIKVRPGEKYALITEAKGRGKFGGVYSILDKGGKKIFPPHPGINCLAGQVGSNWKTFSDTIAITQPNAAMLSFGLLANHDDKTGKKEIYFNRCVVVRLTERLTLNKVLWQGVCVKTSGVPADWNKIPAMKVKSGSDVVSSGKVKWNGPDDLSAACRMAMDNKNMYLRISVKDDNACPPKPGQSDVWENDSVQLAFDPKLEGKDRTEIAISRDSSGKAAAYKLLNFWTSEIPENITRRGLMPDVKVAIRKIQGEVEYDVTIPLRELYPLTVGTKEFGFSWLVNDNDGQGRKYIQWSGGIGPNKDTSQFGLIRHKN